MKAIHVHLQNCHTQIGITEKPVIAWQYANGDAGQTQKSYQIFLMLGEKLCYDSGIIASSAQNHLVLDVPLKSHTRYQLCVSVTNTLDQTQRSDTVSFVTGICREEDWNAIWLSNGTSKPYYAVKGFHLTQTPIAAYLSGCGLGQFLLRINGMRSCNYELEGAWTDYHKRVLYSTYDVTSLLRCGDNCLQIEVANGWYKGDTTEDRHFYTLDKGYRPYGTVLPCILQLTLNYADGRTETIGTGTDWQTHSSATTLANIYGSEDFHADLEEIIFDQPSDWRPAKAVIGDEIPKGKLLPMLYPPVIVQSVYAPVASKPLKGGGVLFDFGQNMSGLFEVTVHGKRGDCIRMSTAEKLDADGLPVYTVKSYCNYRLRGGAPETWRPRFTYQAGRYLVIETIHCDEKAPDILDTRAYFLTSAAENTGAFCCSDERYMKIHDLILRASESNLNHVHTDCPTIERLGWLEESHLIAPSIMYMKNVDTLWDKISADMRDAQYRHDERDTDTGVFPHDYGPGLIPSIAPRYAKFIVDGGSGSYWDIIAWGSTILLGAIQQFTFFGNRRTLEKNYLCASAYVAYLYGKYMDYNKIHGKTGDVKFLCHGLGDWGFPVSGEESRENIETAYLFYDCRKLADLAEQMGFEADAQLWNRRADDICDEYNQALLQFTDGSWYYHTPNSTALYQANQAIPLCFGMVPPDKLAAVEESFLRSVQEGRIWAGEIGLKYVFDALEALGAHEKIHQMIMQAQHPSYYRFVEQGETTLPEFWTDDARSRNHDMMGSVFSWFYRGVGGISSEDGFSTIKIQPHLPGGMQWVKCSYKAVTGEIDVYFSQNQEGCRLEAMLPAGTRGIALLPGSDTEYPLYAGKNTLQITS